ncbi:MAG: DUF3563 family protein [Rubrivivax sp.]|nr:DUF3563 family protein [Rubrivivax sp.]
MLSLFHALARLLVPTSADVPYSDEQYLSEALDLHDLETRMRQLDRGRREVAALGPYGIALR